MATITLKNIPDDLYEQLVEGISSGRKILSEEVRQLVENGPYTARDALQADLNAAQSSVSTMQIVAVAALVVGVVAGYFVGPMVKKQ